MTESTVSKVSDSKKSPNAQAIVPPKGKSIVKHIILGIVFTIMIGIFSIIMAAVADNRADLALTNYKEVSSVYNGPLMQTAPSLMGISMESDYYRSNNLTKEVAKKYVDNTYLQSTDGQVVIQVDFVKKGLVYQPTYKTEFNTSYVLQNKLDEKSVISFVFPFPVNTSNSEISNARLIVDGKVIENAKSKISDDVKAVPDYYDDYYYNKPSSTSTDGLKWEGEIEANGEITIQVVYDTVGLSTFTYEGIENSEGAQDFNFNVRVMGTRAYNISEGLSVDKREFGDSYVDLIWEKPSLYSKPLLSIEIGERLNPSAQISRVYLTMTPVYIVFIAIILFLSMRFGKGLRLLDMTILTSLFVIYFPLLHYLSSFTIDPTMDFYSFLSSVDAFSMPLYGAFLIAFVLVGGLMFYLVGRLSGMKFAFKFMLPTILLFLGFFPLVVTIPEYSMLLVLFGVIALLMIIIQIRFKSVER